MSRQLQENTREFQEAYNTLKAINEQLNDLESFEDVESFIDDTLSISVIHDIYSDDAEGFIIEITSYISLDTGSNLLNYITSVGDLRWSPRREKTQLIDDYIDNCLYQA